MNQLPLDLSRTLRDKGIAQAENHANEVSEGWSDKAYWFFKYWIRYQKKPFKMEDFREWVREMIPEPPSLRAFGALTVKAVKEGLIRRVGYEQVKNAKAHRANASVWAVN